MLVSTAAIAAAVAAPAATALDPSGTCPDGFLPFPVSSQRDIEKDRNNNAIVCRKVNQNGQPTGGPDDTVDDIIIP